MEERAMAIQKMVSRISGILQDCHPSIYLYGSLILNDFRLGWSDIDILVLTEKQMSMEQSQMLVGLRQEMLEEEPDNPYYRSFEGGMLTLDAFLSEKEDLVVYWGTSGEQIINTYVLDSFGRAELVESSALLYGRDIRGLLKAPDWKELYADADVIRYALKVRRDPLGHRDERTFDYAETLAEPIRRFADVLERELKDI